MKKFSEFLLEGKKKKKKTNAEINRAFDKKLGNKPREAEDVSSETEQKGSDALEEIQKEGRKEKHEKKKAIGKAGVKELKKTQKGNETQKRMEAGARAQHERKKAIGKAGAEELKKTFSDAKNDNKSKDYDPKEASKKVKYDTVRDAMDSLRRKRGPRPEDDVILRTKEAAEKARERQKRQDEEKADKDKRRTATRRSRSKDAAQRSQASQAKSESRGSSSRTAGEKLDRERAAVARRERSKLPVSGDDIKSYGKKRAIKYQLGQKSLPKEKRQSLETRKRTARRLARVGPGDIVRAKIDREIRKAKAEPLVYSKNILKKTADRTVKPAAKFAKSVATSAAKSGTTQATGGDVQVGKGTSKDRG